jgi:hypothetical protein
MPMLQTEEKKNMERVKSYEYEDLVGSRNGE